MQSVGSLVALGFIFLSLAVSFVLSHTLHWVFLNLGIIDTPILGDRFTLTTLIAAAVSFGTGFLLWRNATVNPMAHEVVAELKKVTWPTGEETRAATLVVIVTSVVVSLVLGFFDLGFNWVINRIF
ncbi:MAG: preprotein translocase subunit SecE [Deltaproteobacteria bacterium]|nr:preprotein translocase subunit SecE [Deltaproteobacteria bacterium]